MQEFKDATTLLSAGGDGGPNASGPNAADRAARALRDAAVDHHETNGLLSQVVRRLDSWRRDKLKVGVALFAKTFGEILSRLRFWHAARGRGIHRLAGRPLCVSFDLSRHSTCSA